MLTVNKLTDEEAALIRKVVAKMQPLEAEIDAINGEIKELMAPILERREKIQALQPKLAPLAEMKAGIANVNSRNKYFPEFLGRFDDQAKKDAFMDFVKGSL